MTIKRKTQLICILATAVCLAMIFLMTKIFIVRNLLDAEKDGISLDMLRAVKAVSYELAKYEGFAEDWSAWDDVYQFVQDGNEDFITDNMMDTTFKIERLNVMAYFNDKDKVVYAKWFDLALDQEVFPSDKEGIDILQQVLSRHGGPGGCKIKGIVRTPKGPLLVVFRPIVDSLRVKPANGVLVVGRYLDNAELALLSDLTNLQMEIKPVEASVGMPDGIDLADRGLTNVPMLTGTVGNSIYGTATLLNIDGIETYHLNIQEKRSLYMQGNQMLRVFLASVFITAVFFGLIIFFLIDRHILARLLSLMASLGKIKRFEDIPHNFGITGNDEINQLAGSIQEILHELQISHNTMRYMSTHDTLTDAYNRAYLEQYLLEAMENPDTKLGLIMCDLDGLKLANDMGGHAYGDEMLQNLSAALRKSCPDSALIFRIGGDEFLIVVPGATEELLAKIHQRIQQNVDGGYLTGPHLVMPLSVSIGHIVCKPVAEDIRDAMASADNLMYREKLLRSQSRRSGLVQMLRSALEARDHNTEGHAQRLKQMAADLARRVGVQEQRMPDLKLFAEFHDVGKIGVSDSILFKQGPLTAEEWVEMRKHCEIGFRIAHSTPDLAPIAGLILKHHEWWNGAGYPMGLAGDDIPIECRILAIVDAFDAMTHDRPYRPAKSKEQAVRELSACAGMQFDPDLVRSFLEMLE